MSETNGRPAGKSQGAASAGEPPIAGNALTASTPRIARSGEDLRAGQSVAWIEPKDGQWWVCQSYDPDEGWDWTGTEIILSDPEPPAPTLPTTPGSVIEARWTGMGEDDHSGPCLWWRSEKGQWMCGAGFAVKPEHVAIIRVLFDAGAVNDE